MDIMTKRKFFKYKLKTKLKILKTITLLTVHDNVCLHYTFK